MCTKSSKIEVIWARNHLASILDDLGSHLNPDLPSFDISCDRPSPYIRIYSSFEEPYIRIYGFLWSFCNGPRIRVSYTRLSCTSYYENSLSKNLFPTSRLTQEREKSSTDKLRNKIRRRVFLSYESLKSRKQRIFFPISYIQGHIRGSRWVHQGWSVDDRACILST